MSAGMPTWLRTHLEQTQGLVGGVGTSLTARVCKRCGAKVAAGTTPARISERFELDPIPVSALGELQAVLTGRRTVDTIRRDGRIEIHTRRPAHIAATPPEASRHPVLAEHRCGAPALDAAALREADQPLPPNSPPPF